MKRVVFGILAVVLLVSVYQVFLHPVSVNEDYFSHNAFLERNRHVKICSECYYHDDLMDAYGASYERILQENGEYICRFCLNGTERFPDHIINRMKNTSKSCGCTC